MVKVTVKFNGNASDIPGALPELNSRVFKERILHTLKEKRFHETSSQRLRRKGIERSRMTKKMKRTAAENAKNSSVAIRNSYIKGQSVIDDLKYTLGSTNIVVQNPHNDQRE